MNTLQLAELTLIGVELAIGVVAGFWFVAAYMRSPWGKTPAGRHMMFVAAVMAAEMGTLLAMMIGVPVPLWVFALGYGIADAVVVQRLVLLYRARRAQPQGGDTHQR